MCSIFDIAMYSSTTNTYVCIPRTIREKCDFGQIPSYLIDIDTFPCVPIPTNESNLFLLFYIFIFIFLVAVTLYFYSKHKRKKK
jgi:hypothetical protein